MDADFAFLYALHNVLLANFYFIIINKPEQGFSVKGFNSAALADEACPFLHIILCCLVFIHLLLQFLELFCFSSSASRFCMIHGKVECKCLRSMLLPV